MKTTDPQWLDSQDQVERDNSMTLPPQWRSYATMFLAVILGGVILVVAMLIIPGATAHLLTDRFGRKKVLVLALLIYAGGSVLAATATTPGMFIAAQAVLGLGAAFVIPLVLSGLAVMFTAEELLPAVPDGFTVVALTPHRAVAPIEEVFAHSKLGLLVGSEGSGLSPEAIRRGPRRPRLREREGRLRLLRFHTIVPRGAPAARDRRRGARGRARGPRPGSRRPRGSPR